MKCEKEFTFIADILGQLLKMLENNESKQQLIHEVVANMTQIEIFLKEYSQNINEN